MKAPTKTCTRCDKSKSLDQFGKKLSTPDGLQHYCNPCRSEVNREYNFRPEVLARRRGHYGRWSPEQKAAARERHRVGHLRRKFGLTVEDYTALLESQNGLCGVCLRSLPESSRYIHVDHCHRTGKVRGILCQKCNAALGMVGDSTDVLQNAINYLIKHRGNHEISN